MQMKRADEEGRWAGQMGRLGVLCASGVLVWSSAFAQSSGLYTLESSSFSGGGGEAESSQYSSYAAFGQASPVGSTSGETYNADVGFLSDSNLDGDQVLGANDECPTEDASPYDSDSDGCLDNLAGLHDAIAKLPAAEISAKVRAGLLAKAAAAIDAERKGVTSAVKKQLSALESQIYGQKPPELSTDAAAMLLGYIANVRERLFG